MLMIRYQCLALLGQTQTSRNMLNTSISSWPAYSSQEVEAVARILESNKVNYWTGNESRQFEKEFAAWCNVKHAIALMNGTVALDLALHAIGVGANNGGCISDEVIVTPRTFIASISCVVNAGARPVFADVDANSGNLSASTIAQVVTERTKAVIVVHLGGWPCEMLPIMELSQRFRFKVIEDCAQAHGAKYRGQPVGGIGHVGAWSFCQDKIMTTGGEGGMVTTNDTALWSKMWSYKDHGKSWEAVYERKHPAGFRWLHETFGTNWRMLEMQAAIGRLQLKKMNEWAERRSFLSKMLDEAMAEFSTADGMIRLPNSCDDACTRECVVPCQHARYKYYCFVRPEKLAQGWTRDRILTELNDRGVPAYQGSCSEVYLEKAFEGTGWRPEKRLPIAKELGETSLMFLVHPTITTEQQTQVCTTLRTVLGMARG